MDDFVAQVSGVSALAEPGRRALYLYVVAQPEPVSRDQAAEGTGLPRHSAKFHLDKLVEEGLLDAGFRRLTDRTGPGAGRPTKLYRRSARQVSIALPPRHYELAGEILAAGIDTAARADVPVVTAVQDAATAVGRRLGTAESERLDGTPASLESVAAALAEHGFEPRAEGDTLLLANCPFHALARKHTALVCGMNLHLITGLLERLEQPQLQAALDPGPDRCCVTVRTAAL